MTMIDERVRSLVAGQVLGTCDFPDDQRDQLLDQIKQRYGQGLLAVLIYGSYLRGKRDTLLDFYVLLESYSFMPSSWQGWLAKALPPNVYQISHGSPPDEIRAKYAVLTLSRFEYAVRKDFLSYFWARFAQPCGILFSRDESVRERVIEAIAQSSQSFVRHVAPVLEDSFDAKQMWATGLGLTYQCEFRSEPAGHAEKLFGYWPEYYCSMTALLANKGLGYEAAAENDGYLNTSKSGQRRRAPFVWWLRKAQGKVLSTLRIVKAAMTFDDPLEYLLWKIKRHSGVYIAPTALQKKFPLIFAWPLLWRLYRRGAFR